MAIELTSPVAVPAKQATRAVVSRASMDYEGRAVSVVVAYGNGDGDAWTEMPELRQVKQLTGSHFLAMVTALRECRDSAGVSAWDRLLAVIMQE